MNRKYLYPSIFIIALVLVAALFYAYEDKSNNKQGEHQITTTQGKVSTSTTTTKINKEVEAPNESTFAFPVSDYSDRIRIRTFGKLVYAEDVEKFDCGQGFSGYHTALDLEANESEIGIDVPVYSIARGEVLRAERVLGYGGLIVIQHQLKSKTIKGIYGHVDLDSVTVKPGESVKKGEKLAILGKHCSSETSGERKHLHFGLYRGDGVDIRGYVQSRGLLTDWASPDEFLRAE